MDKLLKLFEGKKQYFVALALAIIGLVEAYGITIPQYIYVILAALGVAANRAATAKIEHKIESK